VYGVSTPYVADVAETLRRLDASVHAYVVNVADGTPPPGLDPIVHADDLSADAFDLGFVFPMVTPAYRQRAEHEVRERGGHNFPVIVDPTSIVASSAALDDGAQVNAGVVIGANTRLGHQSLVNRSASVGHDVELLPYATLGPACVLCGAVRVEHGAFVGAGAVLNPGVTIGANAVVGAGSVVVHDVAPNTVVAGSPAKVIREHVAGYNRSAVTWT